MKKESINAVMIIPTGIGCEIGGHCGDGNAPARLLALAYPEAGGVVVTRTVYPSMTELLVK